MIYHNEPQGSEAWLIARAGVITASKFKDARAKLKNGDPAEKQLNYAAQVAVERIAGKPVEMVFVSWQMKAGSAEEFLPRQRYEADRAEFIEEAGFITTDDRRFGVSVDGFINDDGVLEIKTICSPAKMVALWRDKDFSEYIDQCNGAMWLLGRKYVDLVIWCPALEPIGKEMMVHRILRDDNAIEKLEADMLKFADLVDQYEAALRMPVAA
ncbi:MAG: lambda exonuclease family protein [Janthinobacterium lividum]